MHLVLCGTNNWTFGPYLAARNRIVIQCQNTTNTSIGSSLIYRGLELAHGSYSIGTACRANRQKESNTMQRLRTELLKALRFKP
jgi:hypothetical protein